MTLSSYIEPCKVRATSRNVTSIFNETGHHYNRAATNNQYHVSIHLFPNKCSISRANDTGNSKTIGFRFEQNFERRHFWFACFQFMIPLPTMSLDIPRHHNVVWCVYFVDMIHLTKNRVLKHQWNYIRTNVQTNKSFNGVSTF